MSPVFEKDVTSQVKLSIFGSVKECVESISSSRTVSSRRVKFLWVENYSVNCTMTWPVLETLSMNSEGKPLST